MTNSTERTKEIMDEIDIEEYSKSGKRPPLARRYRIRIDRERFVVTVPHMTGRELLVLAGKQPPERYSLTQKLRGGAVRPIGLNEVADFTEPGVERFMTLPLDQTEGEPKRREFRLPAEDEANLESTGLAWETLVDGGVRWLIVRDRPVSAGYSIARAHTALLIPPAYSDAEIDMVYFDPPLGRADGVPINALAQQQIEGRVWQRWSRHRTPQNPWRPGIDSVATHLLLVDQWLLREFGRQVAA